MMPLQATLIAMIPENNPVTRNLKKTTRKRAIEAMCAHCMGCTSTLQGSGFKNHLEAGFRASIANCTASHCPLYQWRPFQAADK